MGSRVSRLTWWVPDSGSHLNILGSRIPGPTLGVSGPRSHLNILDVGSRGLTCRRHESWVSVFMYAFKNSVLRCCLALLNVLPISAWRCLFFSCFLRAFLRFNYWNFDIGMFALSPVSVQVSKKIIIINKRGEVANKHWRQKGWKEIQELTNRAGRLFDTQECTPV